MKFTIEKEIPLSGKRKSILTDTPVKELEINDSFLYPTNDEATKRALAQAIRSVNAQTIGTSEYASRRVNEGVRVWRIK